MDGKVAAACCVLSEWEALAGLSGAVSPGDQPGELGVGLLVGQSCVLGAVGDLPAVLSPDKDNYRPHSFSRITFPRRLHTLPSLPFVTACLLSRVLNDNAQISLSATTGNAFGCRLAMSRSSHLIRSQPSCSASAMERQTVVDTAAVRR